MLFPQMFACVIFTSDPALTQITVWAQIYIAAVLNERAADITRRSSRWANAKISTFLALLRKIIPVDSI